MTELMTLTQWKSGMQVQCRMTGPVGKHILHMLVPRHDDMSARRLCPAPLQRLVLQPKVAFLNCLLCSCCSGLG